MRYKLVAIDLDGTLLDSHGEVSEENKQAIKKLKDQGAEIVITSGRMSSSIKEIAEEIGANKYFISGNGSMIYDIEQNKIK